GSPPRRCFSVVRTGQEIRGQTQLSWVAENRVWPRISRPVPPRPWYYWGGRIRTFEYRFQRPVPYHLATPQKICRFYSSTILWKYSQRGNGFVTFTRNCRPITDAARTASETI